MKAKPSECYVISKRDIELDISKNEREPLQTEYTKFRVKLLREILQSAKPLVPIIEGAFNDGLKSGMSGMGSYRDRQNLLNNEIEL